MRWIQYGKRASSEETRPHFLLCSGDPPSFRRSKTPKPHFCVSPLDFDTRTPLTTFLMPDVCRFLLTRHCPSGQVRAPALWSKAGCTLREVDALQREVRSRRAPQAVDGGGFQGERGPEAWISLFSVGGHGPAGACVDFEPLPHRTETKPREAWPPPGRPPLGCDSRNWALSVGPRFRG